MKKIMTMMFAVTMLFAACSKEKKLNKKLDGEWNVVSIDGTPATDYGVTMTFKFNKDKKEGTYETTYVEFDEYGATTYSEKSTGTYTLTEDEKINLSPTIVSYGKEIMTVTSYSKTDMTINMSDGSVLVLEKV